jgi:hypothetical protein
VAATGLAVTVGVISFANEALFAPLAEHQQPFKAVNWRIVPATALFALALGGIEHLSQPLAVGIGTIALFTVLLTRTGNAPAPVENIAVVLGYKK